MTANTTVTRCHAKILESNMRIFFRIRIFTLKTYGKGQINELKASRIEALPLVVVQHQYRYIANKHLKGVKKETLTIKNIFNTLFILYFLLVTREDKLDEYGNLPGWSSAKLLCHMTQTFYQFCKGPWRTE